MQTIVINPAKYEAKEWSWERVKTTTGIYLFGKKWKDSLHRYLVVVFPRASLAIEPVAFLAYPHNPYTLEQTSVLDDYTFQPFSYDGGHLWQLFSGNIPLETFLSTLTPMK